MRVDRLESVGPITTLNITTSSKEITRWVADVWELGHDNVDMEIQKSYMLEWAVMGPPTDFEKTPFFGPNAMTSYICNPRRPILSQGKTKKEITKMEADKVDPAVVDAKTVLKDISSAKDPVDDAASATKEITDADQDKSTIVRVWTYVKKHASEGLQKILSSLQAVAEIVLQGIRCGVCVICNIVRELVKWARRASTMLTSAVKRAKTAAVAATEPARKWVVSGIKEHAFDAAKVAEPYAKAWLKDVKKTTQGLASLTTIKKNVRKLGRRRLLSEIKVRSMAREVRVHARHLEHTNDALAITSKMTRAYLEEKIMTSSRVTDMMTNAIVAVHSSLGSTDAASSCLSAENLGSGLSTVVNIENPALLHGIFKAAFTAAKGVFLGKIDNFVPEVLVAVSATTLANEVIDPHCIAAAHETIPDLGLGENDITAVTNTAAAPPIQIETGAGTGP